jgi:hypothetical protein
MWHVDPLIGNNRGMAFSVPSAKQELNSNRGTMLSLWSVQRYLVVWQSPAGKNMSMGAEDIVGIRHQETTGEDTVRAVVN